MFFYIGVAILHMLCALPVAILLRLAAYGYRRNKGIATSRTHEAAAVFLIMWVCMLLAMTLNIQFLLEHGFTRGVGGLNLVPFSEIIAALKWGSYHGVVINLLGNIAIFVPIGVMFPLVWRRFSRLWRAAAAGFGLSLFIEITQRFCGRSTDVDDLILNTLGAVIGYGGFALIRRLWPEFCRRANGEV